MKRIIFDTDIGTDVDDAMALALAALSPELDLLGVTTVHADAPLRARIARRILALAGRGDVPVVAGASLPLQMPLPPNFHWMPHLRGHEGHGILNDDELAPTADLSVTQDDAARFIIDTARAQPGTVSLVAVGGLTNVARALQLEPKLADWLHDITLMGGMVAQPHNNWHPMLETNLNCDPLATQIVFGAGVPLTVVPIEVTTQVYLTADQRADMRTWGSPLADTLVTLMEQMLEGMATLSSEVGMTEDIYQGRTYLHDPLAVYTCMAVGLVQTRRCHIDIEIIEQVVRTMRHDDRTPNVRVCEQVDAPAFIHYWLSRLHTYAIRSATNAPSY
jgi:purine nucleosidase